MAEFYRFRSIDALLGKFQELEKQTIYFASPEELNDPMEGLRDIVWDGDKIVWTNFFKHYIFCLNRSCLMLNITRKSQKLDVADIPILERWDQITIPIEKILFDDIWDRFCNLPFIHEIIEALANTTYKIRYREIVCHLLGIQMEAVLDEIQKSYINHGIISESQVFQPLEESHVADGMEYILNLIKQAGNVEDEDILELDAMLEMSEMYHDDIRFTVEYKTRTFPLDIFRGITMLDFPKVYVERLDRLLWSRWYTACFTGSYHNSSVWAKYADGHKGVCLIFEALEKDGSSTLRLNQETTNYTVFGGIKTMNSSITLPFHKVNYADRPGEIDFFRTICRMPVSTLRGLWYTDQDGHISECAAHIESDSDEAVWKELYWSNFFRDVTFKTKDWAYEQEYRLILENSSGQFNGKDDRKLTYNFNSLKGIIFGIRTPTEDIIKIREIIEKKKKCDGNSQTDFKYFQAFCSAKDGDIRGREIRFL